jgi:WD40 repeat protein
VEAYLDKKDIAPGEAWQERLGQLILAADTVVFVISPDSIRSPICNWEVEETRRLSKRLLPVVLRSLPEGSVPSGLAKLNYIFFDPQRFPGQTEDAVFDLGLAQLLPALEVDIVWVREHTRLVALAARWDADGRPSAQLLRGSEITAAEAWLARQPMQAPRPPGVLLEYIQASREHDDQERVRLKRLSGIGFVKPARQATDEGLYDRALRYAAVGALRADDPDFRLLPELHRALQRAAVESRTLALVNHGEPVHCTAFSGDGTRIIAATSHPGVFHAANGQPITGLVGSKQSTRIAALSHTGSRAATYAWNDDQMVRIWDFGSSASMPLKASGVGAGLRDLIFCYDDRFLVGTGLVLAVWNLQTGDQLRFEASTREKRTIWCAASANAGVIYGCAQGRSIVVRQLEKDREFARIDEPSDRVETLALSRDGKYLLAVTQDHIVRVWDLSDRRLIAELPNIGPITQKHTLSGWRSSATFSPDGTCVAVASADNAVRLWDLPTGRKLCELRGHEDLVTSTAFDPTGTRLVTSSLDKTSRIWNLKGTREEVALEAHGGPLRTAAYSPDGTQILSSPFQASSARLSSAMTGQPVATWSASRRPVASACFSPDGKSIALVSADEVVILDPKTNRTITRVPHENATAACVAFAPDGTKIATPAARVAQVWSVPTGKKISEAKGGGHDGGITSISFSPDGTRLLTTGSVWEAVVTDVASGNEIFKLEHHSGPMCRSSYSPNGQFIVTLAEHTPPQLWDARTGKLLRKIEMTSSWLFSVHFFPDSLRIATASRDRSVSAVNLVEVWEVNTGRRIACLVGHGDTVNNIAFSSDGLRIATASDDKTARIWAAGTGELLRCIEFQHIVSVAAFSPCGRYLLTGSDDGVPRMWDVSRTSLLVTQPNVLELLGLLANGVGRISEQELNDPIMTDAPPNVLVAAQAAWPHVLPPTA